MIDLLLEEAGKQILEDPHPPGSDDPGTDPAQLLLVSPLRFDFDPRLAQVGHPASHFTMCRSECRIPVFGALSLGHFIRTIFKHFYPDVWATNERLREWTLHTSERRITQDEEREMFFEWRPPAPQPLA